jgi:predicted alpha/beta superfamily hydrolase
MSDSRIEKTMGTLIMEKTRISSLNREKNMHIFLPSGYSAFSGGYPVLYMHDGHNLFDPSTSAFGAVWKVGETLDRMEKATGKACIVVGIDCPSPTRYDEYSPWPNPRMRDFHPSFPETRPVGGEGAAYVDWILQELKPDIDRRFRTEPSLTWMAGSSMGGLISLFAGFRHPEILSKIGVFSPAAWFAETELLKYLENLPYPDLGVYLDIGTAETSDAARPDFPEIYLSGARRIRKILEQNGQKNFWYREIPGGIHHETAWADRFPDFVGWLMK